MARAGCMLSNKKPRDHTLSKVLYIGRYYPDLGAGPLLRLRRKKNRLLKLRGQCGFMRSALHASFDVTEADLSYLRRNARAVARKADYLIVCSKSESSGSGLNMREFDFIAGIKDIPKALFISNPEAAFMPDDRCLDCFDVVFKREHYLDLDRYAIEQRNKDKIRLAWLDCPLIPARRFNVRDLEPSSYGFRETSERWDADVCFFGTESAPIRAAAWSRVLASDLAAIGGIQRYDRKAQSDCAVYTPPVDQQHYIDHIRGSRVNLALDGLGEFTHRHWEIWLLCSFCLSSPSIRELALPGGAREDEHFVCFDDLDDMMDKIRFFSAEAQRRETIARAGRALFEETFDFKKYGAFVKQCMDDVA